jgi:hypothetical protein
VAYAATTEVKAGYIFAYVISCVAASQRKSVPRRD